VDYVCIDLETSVKNKGDESVGTFHASPYHPDNVIVQGGLKHFECVSAIAFFMDDSSYAPGCTNRMCDFPVPDESTLLVGHNIAFDVGYLARDYARWDEWLDKGMIWDTMIVEYILTGQYNKFVSLNEVSKDAGGTIKDERIKDYWDSGMDTEDIPYRELQEYMLHDVENTEMVFLSQLERADEQGMLPLIRCMMESRLATLEMERNGMKMDRDTIASEKGFLAGTIADCTDRIFKEVKGSFPLDAIPSLKVNSPATVGAYLFGGMYKYKTQDQMYNSDCSPMVFKSGAKKGELKTKWVEHEVNIVGKFVGKRFSKLGKSGKWATGEAVLNKIAREYTDYRGNSVRDMLILRGMMKDMSAYYVGYAALLWHDDILHPSFHHCSTDTGRLSCSKPNLQQCAGG